MVFAHNPDGSYASPPGLHLSLTKNSDGSYSLSDTTKTTWRFQGGWLASATDQTGNTATYNRDSSGHLSTVTDASGRALTYAWDAQSRLASVTDPAGHKDILAYDAQSRLASVADPAGNSSTLGYDAQNRLVSFTDAKGGLTQVTYDSTNRVSAFLDARSTPSNPSATTFSYNSSTLITTVTDPAGKNTTITHNASGNPTSIVDGAGVSTQTNWVNNEATKEADANGSLSTTYDPNGNPTATSETLSGTQNATTSATYDANNNPTSLTDEAGRHADIRYDPRSNLVSSQETARKEADSNTYDAHGNTTSVTDTGAATYNRISNGSFENVDPASGIPLGWTYFYQGTTSPLTVDPTTARYGRSSLKFSSTTPTYAGAYSNFASVTPGQKLTLSVTAKLSGVSAGAANAGMEFYDASGTFISSSYSNGYGGSGEAPFLVTGTAPANASVVTVVVENNGSGTVWFDGVQLEIPTNPAEGYTLSRFNYVDNSSFEAGASNWPAAGVAGAATITNADAWGGSFSAQLSLGTAGTSYLFNKITLNPGETLTLSAMEKTSSVAGTGAYAEIQYYSATNAFLGFVATTPITATTDWTRYAAGTTAPANTAWAYVIVALDTSIGTAMFDNVKVVPASTTAYTYDAGGNYPTNVVDPLGEASSYAYDADGNLTSSTDPAGGVVQMGYDSNNRLTSHTDANGGVTRFNYDQVGSGVTVRDARSASPSDNTYATTFGYDAIRHRTAETDPLGHTTAYSYDKAENLTKVANPSSSNVAYSYDGAGKPTTKAISDSGAAYTYGYDPAGKLASVTDQAGRVSHYTYDAANRLTSASDPWGYQQSLTRDPSGLVTQATGSDNKSVAYAYGTDGRLQSTTDTSGKATTYAYDDAGRPFQIVHGDGVPTTSNYDQVGRVTTLDDPAHPGGYVFFYGWDSRGNLTSRATGDGTQSFGYDNQERLTNWTNEGGTSTSYGYDAVGNMVQKGGQTWTVDAGGRITSPGYTYDADGNMTADGTNTYRFDAQHHLLHVAKVSDGSTVADYTYDQRGLRLSKVTPTSTTHYNWDDQGHLVRETDGSGNVLDRYTWGADGELLAIEQGGAMYYPHADLRGDIVSVTNANANVVATYSYGPWGELMSQTGSFNQPWRYAGYYQDSETNLYYLQQRYYNPNLSRFLSPEPNYSDFCASACGFDALVAKAPVTSTYTYANDRPTVLVDGDGSWPHWMKRLAHYVTHHKMLIASILLTVIPGPDVVAWADLAFDAVKAVKVVRAARAVIGNRGIGTASERASNWAGRLYTGFRAQRTRRGYLVSRDGLRQYRPKAYKSKYPEEYSQGYHSNFQSRTRSSGHYPNNGHLRIR